MSYIGNKPPTGTAAEMSEVTSVNIAAGAVTSTRLADSAVTTTKLADGAVTTVKLADNVLTTAKIADSNVTTAKIADNAVTANKIVDGGVTLSKIADGILTYAKMASSAIATANEIVLGTANKIVTAAQFKLGVRGIESYTLLAERVASNAAALDFTSLITTEYDEYVFELIDIVPVSASILQCWFSLDNGATWSITAGDYGRLGVLTASGSSSNFNMSSAAAASIELTQTVGIQAGTSINGTTKLFSPLNTTRVKYMSFSITFTTAGDYCLFNGAGMRKASLSAVNAVRFIMSTGNISTGIVRMYGIRKT